MRALLLLLVLAGLAAADDHHLITLSSSQAQVVITTDRGAVVRFLLAEQAPITLPRHLRSYASATTAPLAVLDDMTAGGVTGRNPFEGMGRHGFLYSDDRSGYIGLRRGDHRPWRIGARSATRVVLTHRDGELTWELEHALDQARPTLRSRLRIALAPGTGAALRLRPAMRAIDGIHQDYGPGEQIYSTMFSHRGGAEGTLTNAGPAETGTSTPLGDQLAQTVDYAGVRSRFFAAWWAAAGERSEGPAAPAGEAVELSRRGYLHAVRKEHHSLLDVVWSAPREVAPGGSAEFGWTLTVSGMTAAELGRLDRAERRIEYTDGFHHFFKILSNPMTWLLKAIGSLVINYGLAVVVLTLLIKALLYRTTWKQYSSMFAMQKLAPELKRLQEQFAGNRQQLAAKQMELWKKNGVNPLAGCLPMLIQIPIFMALYQTFNHSADLRGSSFLWIHDLTLPDQVIGMPLDWFPGGVLSLNPLPIIYVIVSMWMAWQQKPPEGADETQVMMAKMMRWMPLLFAVIFYQMPSGLVLYFTVQALVSTFEIKYIKKKLGMA